MPEQHHEDAARYKTRTRLLARILSVFIIGATLIMLISHILFPEPVVEDYPPIENLLPVLMVFSVLGLALAWRLEAFGGAFSLAFFLAHLGLFWAIRGYFFPIQMLLIFSPLPLTAMLFLYLGWPRRHAEVEG